MDSLFTLLELKDIKETIGGRVKAQRKRLGLTQDALAERLGIYSQHLGLIERGETWPEFSTWQALAEHLGVNIEYFFAEVEAKPLKPTPQEALAVLADLVKRFGADSVIQPAPASLADALFAATRDEHEFQDIALLLKSRTNGRIDLTLPPKITKLPNKGQKPG